MHVSGGDSTLGMNVIYGPFASAVRIENVAGGITRLDHTSIHLEGSFASTGIDLQAVQNLCYRNNIVHGNATDTTGLSLTGVTLADPADCDGIASGNNVNLNHQAECSGPDCATLCTGSAMCDNSDSPMFLDPTLCLDPSSDLVDAGTDLGYDMNDFSDSDFHGQGPEVGARESGVLRVYGHVSSSCP
jgi:hypothetical protein